MGRNTKYYALIFSLFLSFTANAEQTENTKPRIIQELKQDQQSQITAQGQPKKISSLTRHSASWYSDKGKKTASGIKAYYGIAHRTLPFGTKVLITNPKNGKSVTAVVVDRGPFTKGRELDINQNITEFLQFRGIGKLLMELQ